jgi:hypothetical protein
MHLPIGAAKFHWRFIGGCVRSSSVSSRVFWLLLALLVGARIGVAATSLSQAATRGPNTVLPGDVRRFYAIATTPGTPYRDFPVEYPPVTLGAIELLNGTSVRATTVRLMWSQVALDLVVAGIMWWGWGRRAAVAYLVLGLPFLCYPFLYLRLDLLSVALAIGAFALLRRQRPVTGGALLALACFAKVWPVVLIPVLVLRKTRRAWMSFVTCAALGLVAWVVWGGLDGPVQVLTFRGATGWQIESTVGAIVHIFSTAPVRDVEGAARIATAPGWARDTLLALGAALIAGIWFIAAQIRDAGARGRDALAPLAAISVLLLTATILSPQYVVWLLPFAAIAATYRERLIAALTFVVCSLSVVSLNLTKELAAGAPVPMTIVVIRNALLVALCAVSAARLVQMARPHAEIHALPQRTERVA